MRFLKRVWIWFDDVTGISAIIVPLLDHPVPKGAQVCLVLCARQRNSHRLPYPGRNRYRARKRLRCIFGPGVQHAGIYLRHALRADHTEASILSEHPRWSS